MSARTRQRNPSPAPPAGFAFRCLRFGWWSLAFWLSLGVALEAMHGFKLGWYLDVGHETRRLMLTLAHAHGALLAIVTIVAGLTAQRLPALEHRTSAAAALRTAAVLVPLGFLLGGLFIHDGDPGLGILLVPVGAGLLLFAVVSIARAAGRP